MYYITIVHTKLTQTITHPIAIQLMSASILNIIKYSNCWRRE